MSIDPTVSLFDGDEDITDGTVLQIGPTEYTVKEVSFVDDTDGACSFGDCELQIRSGLHEQACGQVLWHEVLHAILINAGIAPKKHNERAINALSFGLLQVLRDNPEMRVL